MASTREKLDRLLKPRKRAGAPAPAPVSERVRALREELARLSERSRRALVGSRPAVEEPSEPLSLEALVPGEEISTPSGRLYAANHIYGYHEGFGDWSLEASRKVSPGELAHLWEEPQLVNWSAERTLFLDTETTSLSGGAGTVAFMVGVGYCVADGLEVRQFFLRDYDEEPAMLHVLQQLVAAHDYLVTFNGKRFDVPLLQNRAVIQRLQLGLERLVHLDLLFPSRRLWRIRLENCKLSTLEREILRMERDEDLDSALVPYIYRAYLDRRAMAEELGRVFAHNRQDVCSLVLLLAAVCRKAMDPLRASGEVPEDLYSAGIWQEQLGQRELSHACLKAAVQTGRGTSVEAMALWRLSLQLKRAGQLESAVKHWKTLRRKHPDFGPDPYEELAKYYEHRSKDYVRAAAAAREGMKRVSPQALARRQAFEARLRRLRQKARRARGKY